MKLAARYAAILLGIGLIVAAVSSAPMAAWAIRLVDWVRDAGAAGAIVFALAYVAATVLLIPGSILTVGAGFAYGPIWGLALVSPVSVAASAIAFGLGRTALRPWVARKLSAKPEFRDVDAAIGANGIKLVLLLRLSPLLPYTLLNYALALTRISPRDYVVASFAGMLPGTFVYVYLGSLVTKVTRASLLLSDERAASTGWQQALY